MDLMEILLSPLCGAIGLGIAILYHLVHTKKMRYHLLMQFNLLQNSPIGFIYVKNDYIFLNKSLCLSLGVKRPSSWSDFLELCPKDIQDILLNLCIQLKKSKVPFEETLFFQKRAFRVRGQMMDEKSFILWWTDMTAPRRKVLKETQKNKILSQQKELLENALEALPFPAFIRSPEQKSLFANQAVGKDVKTLNALHWVSRPFSIQEKTYTLTYGMETHTEEELQSLIREITKAHRRFFQELPCAVCLFGANAQMISCSKEFARLWHLNEKWLKTNPSYEDFWDRVQENGLMNRVMDFAQYKKQQRNQFAGLSETQEVFLYLPDGKIIRRLMIPFVSGGVILLDEDKST